MVNLAGLEQILDYKFKDVSLLILALTHRSYNRKNNERMEFVGDGILDYVIAANLYQRYPNLSEGYLSKIRAALVNQETLAEITLKIGLEEYLFLGDGEEQSGGRNRPSILADCLEAIFAAIVFDSSIIQATTVIENLFNEYLDNAEHLLNKDFKSLLQEYLQKHKLTLPIYELKGKNGFDHNTVFHIECIIPELNIRVSAQGRTKKEASQVAAELALVSINSFKNINKVA